MELKRRENDRRVAALIETMREMMQVLTKYVRNPFALQILTELCRLRDVNTTQDNSDGQTLEVDLEPLLKAIGGSIHKAGNTIDTYYKQKFIGTSPANVMILL